MFVEGGEKTESSPLDRAKHNIISRWKENNNIEEYGKGEAG